MGDMIMVMWENDLGFKSGVNVVFFLEWRGRD